jgi:hypothetical protein
MSFRWVAACLGLAAFWHGPAWAEPILYTEQAIASGTLGGQDFSDSLVTITLSADTDGVAVTRFGLFTNAGPATVSVGGIGQATLTDSLEAFAYVGPTGTELGITDPSVASDLLDTGLSPAFFYDLTRALAPVSGPSLINANFPFATSDGDLDLVQAGDSSFSASLQPVPEPESFALFGGAVAVLAALRSRRKAITEP